MAGTTTFCNLQDRKLQSIYRLQQCSGCSAGTQSCCCDVGMLSESFHAPCGCLSGTRRLAYSPFNPQSRCLNPHSLIASYTSSLLSLGALTSSSQCSPRFFCTSQRSTTKPQARNQASLDPSIYSTPVMVSPMRLPLGLLEEIALHLIAQTCPLAPRTPPISATEEELDPRPQDVGQLWCTSRSHPVRILSQVCSPLRRIVRKHIWRVVYVYDSLGLDELERMYRYLRCVDGGALAAWTQEFTYSNWSGAWDELGAPEELDELPIYREGDDALQVDANGFVIEEEGRLSDWPAGASFLQGNYMATGADIWALHRFVFGQLSSVERLCWRSQIDPGTIWRGSSLMHVIGRLPKRK